MILMFTIRYWISIVLLHRLGIEQGLLLIKVYCIIIWDFYPGIRNQHHTLFAWHWQDSVEKIAPFIMLLWRSFNHDIHDWPVSKVLYLINPRRLDWDTRSQLYSSTSPHDSPTSSSSAITVRCQVVFGLPRLRFPVGVHNALGIRSWGILSTWPSHFIWRILIAKDILSHPVFLYRVSLGIMLSQ